MFIGINFKKLIVSLIIPIGMGLLSMWLTNGAMETYATLNQPPLSPPGLLFPIVWTILFILMGTAMYLVWDTDTGSQNKRVALRLYGIGIALNFFWTIFFFNFGLYGFSILWLILIIIELILTMYYFYQVKKTAAYLLIPYLLWCLFALYLNIGVYSLN